MTADSYQRDYEAMMEWAIPHRHEWLFDAVSDAYICRRCGIRTHASELKRGEYRRWM